jgi:hypothetical protein
MMTLNKILMAAAMVVGSVSAMGCATANAQTEAGTEGESFNAEEAAGNYLVRHYGNVRGYRNGAYNYGFRSYGARSQGVRNYHYHWVPSAPPATRYQVLGRAPSHRHFWMNGSWQYTNNRYSWTPGRWTTYRTGYNYVQPRYEQSGARWRYIPGHWVAR